MRNSTYTNRWHSSGAYKTHWIERSERMLSLFEIKEKKENTKYNVAEYGCGPNAPVSTLCMNDPNYQVDKYDVEKWDKQTCVLDLNQEPLSLPRTNISIFSGVLEYLNDVEGVLKKAIEASDYVLLSYYFLPLFCLQNDNKFFEHINTRINNGVRNHFNPNEVIHITSNLAVISGMDLWVTGNTNHILLLLRSFNADRS